MKFIDLPKSLKNKILPLYILKGEDFFVINSAIKHLSNACIEDMADFNKQVFDNENFLIDKFIESVSMLPLGSKKRFILLKDIVKLTENDKKLINSLLTDIPDSVCVVIVYNDSWKFLNQGEIVDCGKMNFDILSKFITFELKKVEKGISSDAVKTLINLCSYDMTKINSELKKLSCFSDDSIIDEKDVIALVSGDEEYGIFELTENLGNKKGEKSLKILCNFLERKEPIQTILNLITNHFRRMAHISISEMSDLELSSIFKVKEYAINKARQQSKYFSKVQLKNILKLLENVDEMIKSGKMTAENAIFYLVFKILYC